MRGLVIGGMIAVFVITLIVALQFKSQMITGIAFGVSLLGYVGALFLFKRSSKRTPGM